MCASIAGACDLAVRRAYRLSHLIQNPNPPSLIHKKKHTLQNRELNGHFGNVEFICADVLQLALPPASFDLVFSCWILMYLNDDEVGY